jgi:hypothetical protein
MPIFSGFITKSDNVNSRDRSLFVNDDYAAGTGSDRVIVLTNSTVACIETRSLQLPVLTSSLNSNLGGAEETLCTEDRLSQYRKL